MTKRPFFNYTLTKLASKGKTAIKRDDSDTLRGVLHELNDYRSTAGAAALAEELEDQADSMTPARRRKTTGKKKTVKKKTSRQGPSNEQPPASRSVFQYVRGEDFEDELVELIEGATKVIDYCTYIVHRGDIVDALVDAKNRGVRVNAVTRLNKNRPAVKAMKAAGINVRLGTIHAKYVIADRAVLLGSSNSGSNQGEAVSLEANILLRTADDLILELRAHTNEYLEKVTAFSLHSHCFEA